MLRLSVLSINLALCATRAAVIIFRFSIPQSAFRIGMGQLIYG